MLTYEEVEKIGVSRIEESKQMKRHVRKMTSRLVKGVSGRLYCEA